MENVSLQNQYLRFQLRDKEARAANQWLFIQGIKNLRSLSLLSSLLDLPPPPVVRLAKSAIASNGVLNNIFLVVLHPWLITQNFQDKTEDDWYGRPAVSPVGPALLSVAISSRGASPTVIPSPTEEETQLKVSSKMGHHFVPPTHPHSTLVNSSIKEKKANYLISAYPRILSVSSLPLYDQKFRWRSHSSEFLSEALEKYSWLCLRNIQSEDKWLNFCNRVQCSRGRIAQSENLAILGI